MLFKRNRKTDDFDGVADLDEDEVVDVSEKTPGFLSRLLAKKSATGPAMVASSVLEVIANPESPNKALAFGVTWRTIVTANNGRDAAIKLVKAEKGNVFVYRTSQVGFGRVNESQLTDVAVAPASLAAARLHSGNCLFIIKTYPGEYWIAGTRNGSPTALDRYLKGAVDSDAVEVARIAMEQSGEDHPTVFTNLEHHPYTAAKMLLPHDLFEVALTEEDRLRLIPKQKTSIPKPVLGAIAVAVIALAGQTGYKYWQAREAKRLAAMNTVPDEPPEVSWGRAVSEWESKNSAPDASGLNVVRKSLDALPAKWHGWVVETASCGATDMLDQAGEMQRVWACSAKYNRTRTGLLNRDMQKQIPDDYKAQFTPLNQLMLSWQVVASAKKIDISSFQAEKEYLIETTSKFQRLEPALTQAPNLAFVALDIPAPKRADGTIVPPIDKVQGLRIATLSISGPLRSIDAVLANDIPATWKSLQLTFNKDGKASGLTSSALMAVVTGDMYAKQ